MRKITIKDIDQLSPNKKLKCSIFDKDRNNTIKLMCRIDTFKELDYYKAGGILQYVLNSIVAKAS